MSMNIGMSGLIATSEQMNSISHNIANVGTAGYKSSRTEFQDIYAPEFGGGEMNGVEVAAVRQSFKNGTTTPTGRNGDLAINGEGFFMVESNGQDMYTRNGVFNLDKNGYLVTSDGSRLQGYGVTDSGQIQTGSITDLAVATGEMPARSSTKVNMGVNLDANSPAIDPAQKIFDPEDPSTFTSSATTTVYDSLGAEHEVTQYYVKTADNAWNVNYVVDGDKASAQKTTLAFDANGKLTSSNNFDLTFTPKNGSAQQTIQFDVEETTQFGSEFSIAKNSQDGHAPGQVAGWYFEADGRVYARYSNGQTKVQGQVALARFPNQEGLQQAGNTRWTQTFSSGSALVGAAGTGQLGDVRTGMYENSNVDLSSEMVNLMSAQSNYQANAKTIKVAQEMTQILFQNL
ncbi:flagellar hook protein FlgE [Photobacterium lipolyticum]|uniref:Flagellar hook protein FlgE n=1 Tax=Photobacterium lipolyticum TaxID=266810 RepID=A0A2T3MU92_9GAMM|nr:flagellar hook protein FlgE [Photobacterium lipolyticum]PSW03531.1 flagellar biosynthesis protein FlgE [Photobacterium lipolyticum]